MESVASFVKRVRDDGFALNDARIIPGMAAIALPLAAATGRPVSAISIAAIEIRMAPARRLEVVKLLRQELGALGSRNKYDPKSD